MHYHDPIYGPAEITAPVLIDLIQSAAVQRLHGVMQHGITALIGITQPMTRFEHSVGTMLLAARLGASLEEQIAALLHDVSHTAFSHVIDYVFDGHRGQSYHEREKEAYVAGTDLPRRLAAHGYRWRDFMDEEAFPLLEQPAPALCADRLDYFLRDCGYLGLATPDELTSVIERLVVDSGRIAVDDMAAARWLGYTYIAADRASWANLREVGLYKLAAEAIGRGMEIGLITDRDVWGTDEALWAKLRASGDPALLGRIRLISVDTCFIRDEQAPTFRVAAKLRTIDPDVSLEGKLQPLSALDADFARHRTQYLTSEQGPWPMKVISAQGVVVD